MRHGRPHHRSRQSRSAIEKFRQIQLSKVTGLVEQHVEETLANYGFPAQHGRRIRTNNPLERIIREIRRRMKVVGARWDGESVLIRRLKPWCTPKSSEETSDSLKKF